MKKSVYPELTCVNLMSRDKELDITRPTLFVYARIGIIKPIQRVGKMDVYEKSSSYKRIKDARELKKKGLKLAEIAEKIKMKYNENNLRTSKVL